MRKLNFKAAAMIFAAAVAFAGVSCEGKTGPMGPQGIPGQNGRDGQDGRDGKDGRDGEGTDWVSYKITVDERDWVLTNGKTDELNTFFFAQVRVPALSQYIYENGSVIAYVENIDGVKNGMPFVWHRGEPADDGGTIMWTETYDFDFSPGFVGFYATYSDFKTGIRPGTKTFHVVMFWQ